MAGSESDQGQKATPLARTEGDLKRRRNIADAATGISSAEADAPTEVRFGRFRCVIYVSGASNADLAELRHECTEYADALGWEIAGEFEDREGLLPPVGRAGLTAAVERLKSVGAGAVVTPWRSIISPLPQEYDEVARVIERAGGFLHCMDSDRVRNHPRP
ncbi:hypothetical protein ACFXCZ_25005 [Streptomyces sp. NPDC059396]|uniref:hypothetical protein n=1 Tax=Streptomyces sp. NPDC059396 TaxID=3346819 RepID=UPI0036C26435